MSLSQTLEGGLLLCPHPALLKGSPQRVIGRDWSLGFLSGCMSPGNGAGSKSRTKPGALWASVVVTRSTWDRKLRTEGGRREGVLVCARACVYMCACMCAHARVCVCVSEGVGSELVPQPDRHVNWAVVDPTVLREQQYLDRHSLSALGSRRKSWEVSSPTHFISGTGSPQSRPLEMALSLSAPLADERSGGGHGGG